MATYEPPDRLRCCECNEVIPNAKRKGVAEWVQGLRVNRTGGGPNQIRDWRSMGKWMCHQCVATYDVHAVIVTEPLF